MPGGFWLGQRHANSYLLFMEPSKVYRIEYYEDSDGVDHFNEWLSGLNDQRTKKKVVFELYKLSVGIGDVRSLGEGLMELRIMGDKASRLYFAYEDRKIVVVFAGSSKEDQKRTIPKAKALYYQYLERRKRNATKNAS